MEIAGTPARLRNRRDGVFEDQLLLRARLQQYGELIEASNSSGQFCAIQQVDNYRRLLTADRVEKCVLNILRCLFAVGHVETRGMCFRSYAVAIRLQQGFEADKRLVEM